MELYQLIATINNGTPSTFTLAYTPENFDGVKISQKFSFQNPIGFTPKFSVDTMRIIKSDKAAIDEVFEAYGLESDVTIEIQKLKSVGSGYDSISTFAIDFESYEEFDDYSEFALKSISAIESYNKVKNTEINIALPDECSLPNTLKYINYVSLSKNHIDTIVSGSGYKTKPVRFSVNNESKIYNADSSLSSDTPYYVGSDVEIYKVAEISSATDFYISISADLNIIIDTLSSLGVNVDVNLVVGTHSHVIELASIHCYSGYTPLSFNIDKVTMPTLSMSAGDQLFLELVFSPLDLDNYSFSSDGSLFVDLKKVTDKDIITGDYFKIKYSTINDVLDSIFGSVNAVDDSIGLKGLTGANHLSKNSEFANIKPSEFISSICATMGLIINFENDGSVSVVASNSYFDDLLTVGNAIFVNDPQYISVKYFNDINKASVSVGQESSEYDVYAYLIDWNKKITFSQPLRNASESIELTPKYRSDFSGILDAYLKRSKQKDTNSKDNFIFDPSFTAVSGTSPAIDLYDHFTPRDILQNWSKFLSFAFQNFGKDTLTLSSNGGTPDNLQISGVNQMDDLVFSETPRLLPIEYDFTCLIDSIDFSKNILKINHEGLDVYLFVFEAETTDNLSEQKIKALKIQF